MIASPSLAMERNLGSCATWYIFEAYTTKSHSTPSKSVSKKSILSDRSTELFIWTSLTGSRYQLPTIDDMSLSVRFWMKINPDLRSLPLHLRNHVEHILNWKLWEGAQGCIGVRLYVDRIAFTHSINSRPTGSAYIWTKAEACGLIEHWQSQNGRVLQLSWIEIS